MASDNDNFRVLALDSRVNGVTGGLDVVDVDSDRAVLLALRHGRFDLLLMPAATADGPVWPLLGKVRRVRPGLRWWLIARGLGPADEVLARTLGVARILPGPPAAHELLPPARAGPPQRAAVLLNALSI